jgi:hypothetical protein
MKSVAVGEQFFVRNSLRNAPFESNRTNSADITFPAVPSINVIQHKNHAFDRQVELDARKGKRDFVESGLEKCGFEDSGLLLGRRIPL